MITTERLTRSYGAFRAVDGVSFRIGHGEIVGLLGHNGAGKTTIMKMLTGYLEPDEGRIEIDGLDMARARRAIQARIGYLPENCPLYPEMTVVEYLDFAAGLHGVPPAGRSDAVRRAVQRTALQDKALQPIATLSRGYRQRVGVAQAILHRPRILILDEPTNGLDPSQIQHMRSLIRELAREATVILSTHILQEVQATCDRVLILRGGVLALDARLDELHRAARLLVTVAGAPEEVTPLLAAIPQVGAVTHLGAGDGRHRYALQPAEGVDDPLSLSPAVSAALCRAGLALHALEPERRDLETLFNEINRAPSATEEVSHA